MLFGVGCDLCEVARMEKSLFGAHGAAFEARVFGTGERQALALAECRADPSARRCTHRAASAAADFAAKEAFLKAAGTGLREPFSLCEIEVLRLPSGAPVYRFSGRTAAWVEEHHVTARLSLSHDGGMALAFCVLEQTETCSAPLHKMEESPRVHTAARHSPY